MRTVAVLIYLAAPLILSLSVTSWFWRIEFLRQLRNAADEIDGELCPQVPRGCKLREARAYKALGDKHVVTHHLRPAAEDLVEEMGPKFRLTTALALLILINYTFQIAAKAPDSGLSAFLRALSERVTESFVAPAGVTIAIAYYAIATYLLRQQVRRYRSTLEPYTRANAPAHGAAGLTTASSP